MPPSFPSVYNREAGDLHVFLLTEFATYVVRVNETGGDNLPRQ